MTDQSFSPEFANWLATAPLEDLADAYCENYKDAHGIKARWVRADSYDRAGWATAFAQLGADIEAEYQREQAENAALMARLASCGLTDWAERNGIKSQLDLDEYNYNNGTEY